MIKKILVSSPTSSWGKQIFKKFYLEFISLKLIRVVLLRQILKDKGGKQLFTNFFVLTWGLRYFWKRWNIRKRIHWNGGNTHWNTLCIGVSRKFHLNFTLIFSLRYYKMVQSLYRNWLLVSKIIWEIWTTSDKQRKVQKVEIWWTTFAQKLHLSKKYIPHLKRYIQRIFPTLLSTTCAKLTKVFMSFLKP